MSKARYQQGSFNLPPLPPNRDFDRGAVIPQEETSWTEAWPREGSSRRRLSLVGTPMDDPSTAVECPEGRHFLDGVKIQHCMDLLSIPDPPSPQSKKKKRRLSTSHLPRPLRDLTNDSPTFPHHTVDGESDTIALSSSSNRKRSSKGLSQRKSLCHVASPVVEYVPDGLTHFTTKVEAQVPCAPSPINIITSTASRNEEKNRFSLSWTESPLFQSSSQDCRDYNEACLDNGAIDRNISSKLDSSHLPHTSQDWDSKPPAKSLRKDEMPCQSKAFISYASSHQRRAPDIDVQCLQGLRKLVHGYTAANSTKETAMFIDSIVDLTGYEIVPPLLSIEEKPSTIVTVDAKADLWTRVGPDLKKLDRDKIDIAKAVAQITSCRVEKANGGRMRYVLMDNNRKISPSDYEQRYMSMLDDINLIQSEVWSMYFTQLKCQFVDQVTGSETVTTNGGGAIGLVEKFEQLKQHGRELKLPSCVIHDDTPSNAVMKTTEETFVIDNEAIASPSVDSLDSIHSGCRNDRFHTTSDYETLRMIGGDGCAPLSEAAVSSLHTHYDSSSNHGDAKSDIIGETNTSGPLLPIPSRHDSSSDPDIAQAEAKLWKAIDDALKTYSREVLAITAARRKADSRKR